MKWQKLIRIHVTYRFTKSYKRGPVWWTSCSNLVHDGSGQGISPCEGMFVCVVCMWRGEGQGRRGRREGEGREGRDMLAQKRGRGLEQQTYQVSCFVGHSHALTPRYTNLTPPPTRGSACAKPHPFVHVLYKEHCAKLELNMMKGTTLQNKFHISCCMCNTMSPQYSSAFYSLFVPRQILQILFILVCFVQIS